MGQFRDVLLLLSRLKAEGVIHDYAIGGAVAVSLWAEPVATQDLDVIVTVAGDAHPLDPLRPLLDWFNQRGQTFEGEHVLIAGVPVQFLAAWSPLVREAVATATETPYDPADPQSPTIRLIRPDVPRRDVANGPGGRHTPKARTRSAPARGWPGRRCPADGASLEDEDVTMKPTTPFDGKAQWHAQQRQLPPREKIRILIELQRREIESNRIRKSLGRPAVAMKPWDTQA